MSRKIKLFATVSRAEFIMPNLGSLIMGLAWGISSNVNPATLIFLMILSFTVINLSSAIGAQINTLSDYELDTKDERKKYLVTALDSFGKNRLKLSVSIELVVTAALVVLFAVFLAKPVLLVMWLIGIFLGWAYSAPPLRVKAKSWLAPFTLILVLAVLPVLFAYFAFTGTVEPLFLLSLFGLALTVYSVIVPTEIRDYFGDKDMGIITMTVRLGLVKASLIAIILLAIGGVATITAFLIKFLFEIQQLLIIFVFPIAIAVSFVLGKFRRLYQLSKEYERAGNQSYVKDEILTLSANNPKWIMIVTQTYMLASIVLAVAKFLF